jgi:pyrimidine deaminase RibD-like protein
MSELSALTCRFYRSVPLVHTLLAVAIGSVMVLGACFIVAVSWHSQRTAEHAERGADDMRLAA